jgi:perosamine synthetase
VDFIPYGRHSIDENDIKLVGEVLRGDWLTTGPYVEQFEQVVAASVGTSYGVAVSSGTAALHAALHALDLGAGDEVIVPPMTFAATANSVLYCGATPVFADVEADTLCIDPIAAERLITPKTKAIIGVDYAGQPCDWAALRSIADLHELHLVADGCHALGARYKGKAVGQLADMTVFSFHPVKHIATGEGGMIVTDNAKLASRMKLFRNHGISSDHREREKNGSWFYEQIDLGFNYRISDIQCALGISQMSRFGGWLERRRDIAEEYRAFFLGNDRIRPLGLRPDTEHAWHLYVVKVPASIRQNVFAYMRDQKIGVNVHYIPVHFHPYYRQVLGTTEGMCPVAEAAYGELLSIPMYPGLTDEDVQRVCSSLVQAVEAGGA